MTHSIAERTLQYRPRGESELRTLVVRVFPPFELKEGQVTFPFHPGTAGCVIRIDGLPDVLEEVTYGADTVQALELAVKGVEPILERVGKHHDLFFPTGEPYFEE
jgi:hypothetical protein